MDARTLRIINLMDCLADDYPVRVLYTRSCMDLPEVSSR
jgi:hypothetical protein